MLFFFRVLKDELDEIKSLWNSHRIGHIINSNCPGGHPDVLYFTPEGSGGTDCKFHLDSHDVKLANDYCETPSLFGCSAELQTLVENGDSYSKFFSVFIIKGSTILFIKHRKIKMETLSYVG